MSRAWSVITHTPPVLSYPTPSSMPVMNSSSRRIGLAWATTLSETGVRWTRLGGETAYSSGLILGPRAGQWDSGDVSNAAPLVLPNGTVLLGYRAGGDGVALSGGIGIAVAEAYDRPYTRAQGDSMLFPAEDGALWRDVRGGFHFLVHR